MELAAPFFILKETPVQGSGDTRAIDCSCPRGMKALNRVLKPTVRLRCSPTSDLADVPEDAVQLTPFPDNPRTN